MTRWTTIDHALTQPWTVTKSYRRDPNPILVRQQLLRRTITTSWIGKENYFLSADGPG